MATEDLNKPSQADCNDLGALADDSRALLAATADCAGETVKGTCDSDLTGGCMFDAEFYFMNPIGPSRPSIK